MTRQFQTYHDAVAFHGHSCPGLALGYRAARHALSVLHAERSEDEDLVAVVENDACGIDAVQAIAGCSVGKGNLILKDLGKHAYTFINRRTGSAIRIVQRSEPLLERIDPVASETARKSCGRESDANRDTGV